MEDEKFEFIPNMNENQKKWDDFVLNQSINGTFLQTRNFLNYHPETRFLDASILIYDHKKNLIGVCPGCEVLLDGKKTFYSHKGSTFGGIIIDEKHYEAKYVLAMIEELREYLIKCEYKHILLKMTSDIFSKRESDLFQYAFQKAGFKEYKELSTYIDFANYKEDILSNFAQRKRRNVHNCIKAGLQVKVITSKEDMQMFYQILCENLMKYDVKPVHTLEELMDFKDNRLQEECEFFGVFKENKMIAGSMMFYFKNTNCAHTQYLAADAEYNKLSPMTYLYYSMIEEMKKRGYKKLSWGIATEELGQVINMGLITSKEDYGSVYCNNLTYEWKCEN